MDFGRTDLAMAIYNVAVVMSGGYLVLTFGIESHIQLLPTAVVVGLLWTLYFNLSMESLLENIRTGSLGPDEEDEEDELTDADEDDDHRGADPPWN